MKKIMLLILTACIATMLCSCGKEVEGVLNQEPDAEETDTTEPSTESTSEDPTEIPTETPTEPPTEAPTEAPTEPPTEPEVHFTITSRDTMLEGTSVNFNIGFHKSITCPSNMDDLDYMVAPILNGSEIDNTRKFCLNAARSVTELQSVLFMLEFPPLARPLSKEPEFEQYDDAFFRENALIVIYQGGKVESLVKNGGELCIGASIRVKRPDLDTYPAVLSFSCTIIETSKADLDGIDTISFFIQASN